MRIAALALAEESRRFVPGYPPKGARFLLRPNLEISRLAELVADADELEYRDQRVETLDLNGPADLCVVHVGFGQETSARDVAADLDRRKVRRLLFGPAVTAWGDSPPDWCGPRVVGDILNAWPEVRADLANGSLKCLYRADRTPCYHPPRRQFGRPPNMNIQDQTTVFIQGCHCADSARSFCERNLYYGGNRLVRTKDEVVGEVVTMPGKRIRLLDDDVAGTPDYYYDVFRSLWNYKKLWTVNAGDSVFGHPELINLLAKAGTRVINLNESFLDQRLGEATRNDRLVKKLYRRVKYLQSRRMLVGARTTIRLSQERPVDYERVASVLRRADLDFVQLRFLQTTEDGAVRPVPATYEPMLDPTRPAWITQRFYSISMILNRIARRPRRAGFYTTAGFLLPYSMAFRQNFLEGISTV